MKDISIIIPLYNIAPFVEGCLQSVVRQTCLDEVMRVECLLVDDCSTDETMDVAESFVNGYMGEVDFKILHHVRNRGLSAARNTGLEQAKGRYVFFLDSDDALTEDCLAVLYAEAEKTGADVTVGEYIQVSEKGKEIEDANCTLPHNSIDTENVVTDNPQETYLEQGRPYMMAWNKLCRRDFLLSHPSLRFVEGLVHEDNPWALAVALKAKRVAMVNHVTYRYLVRENSLQTDSHFERHFGAYLQIMQIETQLLSESEVEAKYWQERQHALFFGETRKKGSVQQQHEIYGLIRKLRPLSFVECLNKINCHYLLPEPVGFRLYSHLYGNHLM